MDSNNLEKKSESNEINILDVNKQDETKDINEIENKIKNEKTNISISSLVIKKEKTNISISSLVIKKFDESVNQSEKIQKKIKTLCFSGGGIKGFSFLGALQGLIEKKIVNLSEIKCFVGTSIGAMLAFLLNLEWEIEEIKEFIFNFNFSKLKGEINSISFFQNYGIQDGDRFKLLLIKFLESKLNVKDITFEELYLKTNKKLIIIGANLSKAKEIVFSYKNTPNFSVILALRISTSVPVIFAPVIYENEYYVDGGIVNNFPLNHCSKKSTIGFYIKNSDESNDINSLKKLITTVFGVTADTISEKNIKKYFNSVIQIKNSEFIHTNFDIDLETKKKIIDLGYKSVDDFLLKYNSTN